MQRSPPLICLPQLLARKPDSRRPSRPATRRLPIGAEPDSRAAGAEIVAAEVVDEPKPATASAPDLPAPPVPWRLATDSASPQATASSQTSQPPPAAAPSVAKLSQSERRQSLTSQPPLAAAPSGAKLSQSERRQSPPPRKSWIEVVAEFLEERNIRVAEVVLVLVGGLLIVGGSIAVVITFWNEMQNYFKLALFVGISSAVFGLGLITFHRWSLEITGRGLLMIAVLLAPLNFLAMASLGPDSPWAPLGNVTLHGSPSVEESESAELSTESPRGRRPAAWNFSPPLRPNWQPWRFLSIWWDWLPECSYRATAGPWSLRSLAIRPRFWSSPD